MTQDKIIELARQSGWTDDLLEVSFVSPMLEAFAKLVAAKAIEQRTWVGLTDEEIDKAWRSVDYTVPWEQHRIDIAKAIEAKLKEKNNG